MTDNAAVDVLDLLQSGRISYELARRLTGPLTDRPERAILLDRLLSRPDAGTVLTRLLIMGFRAIADAVGPNSPKGEPGMERALNKIADTETESEMDAAAANPFALTW